MPSPQAEWWQIRISVSGLAEGCKAFKRRNRRHCSLYQTKAQPGRVIDAPSSVAAHQEAGDVTTQRVQGRRRRHHHAR